MDSNKMGNRLIFLAAFSVAMGFLEATVVVYLRQLYYPALEEGIFPSEQSIIGGAALEEERRLFYVACTRAKERLYLSSIDYRMKFGRTSRMLPSRYLVEIKGSYNKIP